LDSDRLRRDDSGAHDERIKDCHFPLIRLTASESPWIVAIGASGEAGLGDIKELLAALPSALPAVIMVVLHRRWNKPTHLREVLARVTALPVNIAAEGEYLDPGKVYIGEPEQHLTLAENTFGKLTDDPARDYGGRTVDLLFNSVAAHAGGRMIGVILSGALDDGSRGLAAIRKAGGLTMVLTPVTLPERGMPDNAITYDGPISLIGDAKHIADGLCAACGLQTA
jgi:two-component system chemotaxis response regulator CheB